MKIKYKITRYNKEYLIEGDFPDYLLEKFFEKKEMTKINLIKE